MKEISVSTSVFSLIWSLRQEGEETENDILERILLGEKSGGKAPHLPKEKVEAGFIDPRNGVRFKEGFEIFRNYKGKNYMAIATKGNWKIKGANEYYSSLNQLSQSIIDGNENAWVNWNYKDKRGFTKKLVEYRNRQLHVDSRVEDLLG
jgi:hypothetical protein